MKKEIIIQIIYTQTLYYKTGQFSTKTAHFVYCENGVSGAPQSGLFLYAQAAAALFCPVGRACRCGTDTLRFSWLCRLHASGVLPKPETEAGSILRRHLSANAAIIKQLRGKKCCLPCIRRSARLMHQRHSAKVKTALCATDSKTARNAIICSTFNKQYC